MIVTYIGHSTLLFEMEGLRLLTDPLLRQHAFFLRRHSLPVQPALLAKLAAIDLILLSHAHGDHLDLSSLRLLERSTQVIAPVGVKAIVKRLGFNQVEEVAAGAEFQIGPLSINVTAALHGSSRYFFVADTPCVGYVIQGRQRLYFAGDTDIFPEMAALAGTLDLALLPVWGWGPTLGPGHLDPYRAAQALALLAPKYAIPIHWGSFVPWGVQWLRPRFLVDPPHAFAHHAQSLAPNVDVRILTAGDSFALEAEEAAGCGL